TECVRISWLLGSKLQLRLALRPVLGRTAAAGKIARRIDEPYVRKRLWKVADQPARHGIVSFRQKTDVVANIEQPFKYGARFIMAILQCQIISKPKRTSEKRAFARRQTVDCRVRVVPRHKAVLHQIFLNGCDGS